MKISLFPSLAVTCFIALASCQSTKPSDETPTFGACAADSPAVRTVSDVPGTLYFDSQLQQYRVQAAQAGTVDVVDVGVVCGTLPKAWQVTGRKVRFSGTYKEYRNPPVAPAGTTYYFLELTKLTAQ